MIRCLFSMCMCLVAFVTEAQTNKETVSPSNFIDKETTPTMVDTEWYVAKEAMQSDGFVRLSKIEVDTQWLDEYKQYAVEVGTVSLQTEPGVLTMYAVADKENPNNITILETYSSQESYRKHIASPHFQKYKRETLHMIKSLVLDDVTPLNPDNQITNFILDK